MKRGNLGEWSEVYAFLRILLLGEMPEIGSDLKISDRKIQVAKLLRDDASGIKYFPTKADSYFQEQGFVNKGEIQEIVEELPAILATKSGVFELPKVENLLNRLGINKIKASSGEKIDLKASIVSGTSGTLTDLGYSIKSEVGGSSTLLNASSHTIFGYEIEDPFEKSKYIAHAKVRQLVSSLVSDGVQIRHLGPRSEKLSGNLSYFGETLWRTISQMLLLYYSGQGKNISSLLEKVSAGDAELKRNSYQVGQFLKAVALGMTPGVAWEGDIEAYGGYLIVTKAGDVLALPASNEDEFRKYLIRNSFLDTPSTTRHGFGSLTNIASKNFLDLSLQIRFS
jgi:type II restriction enzyme